MSEEDELRRALAAAGAGPQRAPLLHELGQALAQRHWRIGVGTPAARPSLDEAIAAFRECLDLLAPDDGYRGPIAGQLGQLLAHRYTVYAGDESDRETGIRLIEEALPAIQPAVQRDVLRVMLGQLYLGRVIRALGAAPQRLLTDRAAYGPDAGRAVAVFDAVLQDGPSSTEIGAAATALRELAAAVREMSGAADLGRLMRAVTAVQRVQTPFRPAEDIAQRNPLDRPIPVVRGRPSATPPQPRPPRPQPRPPQPQPRPPRPQPRPPRPQPLPPDLDGLRRRLRDRIVRNGDLYAMVSWRLSAQAPDARLVDDWVALATLIARAGGGTTTDRLLYAAGLYLRGRGQPPGKDDWGDSDLQVASETLRTFAPALPGEPPTVVAAAVDLAAGLGLTAELAAGFGPVVAAMRTARVDAWSAGPVVLRAETGAFAAAPAGEPGGRLLVTGQRPVRGRGTVSYVAGAAEIVELAGRPVAPTDRNPVLVAVSEPATVDTVLLRRRFYPRSAGLGRVAEDVHGPATADEVLARLDASMLALGCDVDPDGTLRLAGSDLSPAAVAGYRGPAGGGLAVLPPVGPGFWPLADALLAAGFSGVVGWLRPVAPAVASLALYVLHERLSEGLAAAGAVRAVREWFDDPARTGRNLPAPHAATLAYADLEAGRPVEALLIRGL